jgi:hypothetical protein
VFSISKCLAILLLRIREACLLAIQTKIPSKISPMIKVGGRTFFNNPSSSSPLFLFPLELKFPPETSDPLDPVAEADAATDVEAEAAVAFPISSLQVLVHPQEPISSCLISKYKTSLMGYPFSPIPKEETRTPEGVITLECQARAR